ncbi:MAG: AMP-binding protein [Tistlia sp.]|uniref:AMP-binding protein n=1 Tax=Tistlia sp. TaxID=3057121 RepID=UPI0034A405A7
MSARAAPGLADFLAGAGGSLVFLGRSVTAGQLDARAEALAGALEAAGAAAGDTVALLLPDSPGLVAAAFATLRLGGRPQLLDPTAPAAAQAAALRQGGAMLLLTFDLRLLLDRALVLAGERPGLRVGLLRASEELPFPRNLLEPLLRGGRFGQRPAHPDFFRLAPARRPLPGERKIPEAATLLLSDGESTFGELLAVAPAAWQERQRPTAGLPLHGRKGLAALLACLAAGGSYRIGAGTGPRPGAPVTSSSA